MHNEENLQKIFEVIKKYLWKRICNKCKKEIKFRYVNKIRFATKVKNGVLKVVY